MKYKDIKLIERLQLIKKHFDIDTIIKPKQDKKEVQNYFRKTHYAYLSLFSNEGFMHMGLSYDGKFKKEDLHGQLHIIDEYFKKSKAKQVLELGAGNGANSAYLAKKNPKISFTGLDLTKYALWRFRSIKNYRQVLGDYHDLSRFKDNTFEVIFAIETVCYSTDKKTVLNEIYKKLRPKGVFIIFDGYTEKLPSKMTTNERLSKILLEKSMAVEQLEHIKAFKKTMDKSGLTVIKEEDLTAAILPSLKRIENRTFTFMKLSHVTKFLIKTLPFAIVKNVIAGLLFVPNFEELRINTYYLHVLKKEK